MKHTEKYLQAKWVTENPDGYDERDLIDAKRYCNAYLDGYNQALSIANVSVSSLSNDEIDNNTPMYFDAEPQATERSKGWNLGAKWARDKILNNSR